MSAVFAAEAKASALLSQVFAPSVAGYELREPAGPSSLLAAEAASCDAFRPKRLEEFAAGRLCARRALVDLGLADFAILRNRDRSPRWPPGVAGSITHTVGFCGAVAALQDDFAGLGVDAEIVARVTTDLWSHAFTADELGGFAELSWERRERAAAVAFSAKEAFYKCQFTITGQWLDYCDVGVAVVPESPSSGAMHVRASTSAGRRVMGALIAQGRYAIESGLVVTGVALSPAEARLLPDFAKVEG